MGERPILHRPARAVAQRHPESSPRVAQAFWAIVIGFLFGVFLRSFETADVALAAAASVGALGLAAAHVGKRMHRALAAALFLIAAGCGIARMESATVVRDPALLALSGSSVVLEGEVSAEPDVREGGVRVAIAVRDIAMRGTKHAAFAGVLAVLPPGAALSYGQHVRVSGTLALPEAFDSGEGRQFDYPSYLAAQGISFMLNGAHVQAASAGSGNPLKALAIGLKRLFLSGLRISLPEPEAAFAGGITVGDKRSVGIALTKDFQIAGLIHMLVLSGYNITVVLNAIAWTLRRTPLLMSIRSLPLAASSFVVLLFILMSGGASSAARAGAMALVAVLARLSRRTFLAPRALALAAALIVVWNPYTLCFDPGFQLSALATVGLIAFTPLIAERLRVLPQRWGLREIASSTIATQLAVVPLLVYQNGQLSVYALPANLLTLPLVPYAMFGSLVAGVAGILSAPLGVLVGAPTYLMLSYIITLTELIAHAPYAGLVLPAFSAWWLAPAYAALFSFALYVQKEAAGDCAPAKGGRVVPPH